jgi:hypothetical protein
MIEERIVMLYGQVIGKKNRGIWRKDIQMPLCPLKLHYNRIHTLLLVSLPSFHGMQLIPQIGTLISLQYITASSTAIRFVLFDVSTSTFFTLFLYHFNFNAAYVCYPVHCNQPDYKQ